MKMTSPLCLFWSIWRESNQMTFKNLEQSKQALESFLMSNVVECLILYFEASIFFLILFSLKTKHIHCANAG